MPKIPDIDLCPNMDCNLHKKYHPYPHIHEPISEKYEIECNCGQKAKFTHSFIANMFHTDKIFSDQFKCASCGEEYSHFTKESECQN